jgi:hypothetical protein
MDPAHPMELPPGLSELDAHWWTPDTALDDTMIHLWRVFGRCTAQSKQQHRRCRRIPIAGGTVCEFHGGKAPQVARSAKLRLEALKLPAIYHMGYWIQQREFPATAASMINSVLDRTGLEAVSKSKHSGTLTTTPGDEQRDMDERIRALLEELPKR